MKKVNPTCVGTGLVALDVVLNGNPLTPPKLHAGGSCGNVLTILSFLGWNAFPIARLTSNRATKELVKDLKKWNVNTTLISKKSDGSTPIIIHRILKDKKGNPKHKFEFTLPGTNEYLPGYKPVLSKDVEKIIEKQTSTLVFYFDRISRSSIELAKHYRSKGGLVFFEPTSMKDPKLFGECLQVSHILKYSHERIPMYKQLFPTLQVPLEIETLGSKGLQYRTGNTREWKSIAPFYLDSVIDAAGAGDWSTAGIIIKLAYDGAVQFFQKSDKEIQAALKTGQAFGALNCLFDGARGMMYHLSPDEIIKHVQELLENKRLTLIFYQSKQKLLKEPFDIKSLL